MRNGPGSEHFLFHPSPSLRKCPRRLLPLWEDRPRPHSCLGCFPSHLPPVFFSHSLLLAFRSIFSLEPSRARKGLSGTGRTTSRHALPASHTGGSQVCPLEGFPGGDVCVGHHSPHCLLRLLRGFLNGCGKLRVNFSSVRSKRFLLCVLPLEDVRGATRHVDGCISSWTCQGVSAAEPVLRPCTSRHRSRFLPSDLVQLGLDP